MKKFFSRFGKKVTGSITAVLSLTPVLASASGFSTGAILPTNTTSNFTSALDTYFFQTILATVFQNQMIQIIVICAAVGFMLYVVRLLWGKVAHPHR